MNSPAIPHRPLDHPHVTKFALGQSISEILAQSGKYHLLITAPSDSTTPKPLQGRRIIHAMSCTREQLDGAYRVASGSHRAVKIR